MALPIECSDSNLHYMSSVVESDHVSWLQDSFSVNRSLKYQPQLKDLKRRNAAKTLELCKIIQDAVTQLEEQNTMMDAEAELIQPDYINLIQDFKVTFETAPRETGEELDDVPTTLIDCAD
jgi:hypothetical protein